jgi:membrane protein implicated in regulation of membrane protease activity
MLSKSLIVLGIIILIIGLLLEYAPFLLNWFGKLPGDIRVKGENSLFFMPITSMIILSIVLSVVANLFFRK